ncbi:hypothetical protein, partial [Neorhizobium vignae]|uniref:hypothetical protein n=1 Tax=Neorhizobium vignae TaxID=690585 RepID=UPI000562D4B8
PKIDDDIALTVDAALRHLHLFDLALLVLEPLTAVRLHPICTLSITAVAHARSTQRPELKRKTRRSGPSGGIAE